VFLTTPQEPGAPTHIDAGLFGLEQFAVNNTFRVCLVSGPGTPSGSGAAPSFTSQVLADVQTVLGMGYDASGVVTTASPVGSSFIGISGVNVASADGASQWVFFLQRHDIPRHRYRRYQPLPVAGRKSGLRADRRQVLGLRAQ